MFSLLMIEVIERRQLTQYKICFGVQLSCWCEKAEGDLGRMPTERGEKKVTFSEMSTRLAH